MRIYLVRHGSAASRSGWAGPDPLRPLTARGHRQARGVVKRLAGAPLARIVSSPHTRCRQTIAPLAAARGLPLELEPRLAEGSALAGALEVICALRDRPTALCSHGDLIPALIDELALRGTEIAGPLLCQQGSIWSLEGEGAAPSRAVYLAPLEACAQGR